MDAIKCDDWLAVRVTHTLANRKQIDANVRACTFNFSLITRNTMEAFFPLSKKSYENLTVLKDLRPRD